MKARFAHALPVILLFVLWIAVIGIYIFEPRPNLCVIDHPGFEAIGVCYPS